MWIRSVVRIVPYRLWSLEVSYLKRMVLPIDVSAVMTLVTALTGQVSASRVLEDIQSLAVSSSAWLEARLGWRDRTDGTSGIGDDDILLACGEMLEMVGFFWCVEVDGKGKESRRPRLEGVLGSSVVPYRVCS